MFGEATDVFLGNNPGEEEHDGDSNEIAVPAEDPKTGDCDPHAEADVEALRFTPAELQQKLRTVHRNSGHPCQSTMLRLLRDAGADAEVLSEAAKFDIPSVCSGVVVVGANISTSVGEREVAHCFS